MTIYEDTLPACAGCELRLRSLGRFGTPNDPVLLKDIPIVERDSSGRFYATVAHAWDHDVVVYDRSGEVLGTVGRFGQGPGEFRMVQHLRVGPGDSLFVVHDLDRVSVFDAEGTYPSSPGLDGSIWLYIMGGYRLANVGSDGSTRRVIGVRALPGGDTGVEGLPAGLGLIMTAGEYTAHRLADTATSVGQSGLAIARTEIRADPAGPPPSPRAVRGFAELAGGLLAVVTWVPATHWQGARVRVDTTRYSVEAPPDPGFDQQLFDSLLDVIDVPTGLVLARIRVPSTAFLTSDGTLYVPAVGDYGLIRFSAYEIEFVRGR